MRDNQREKLYRSEKAIWAMAKALPEIADLEAFVERVMTSKRVAKAYPLAARKVWGDVAVRDGRRRRRGCANTAHINMPRWTRQEAYALHELAHTIVMRQHWSTRKEMAAHGWEFCATFLKLVLWFMGREAHDTLKASMKAHRVRFSQPRKRQPMSPERRAQLIATLAAARMRRQNAANDSLLS